MTFAPIALFAFKRPGHTLRALRALAKNAEFSGSPLFIFCDGSRNAVETEAVEQTRAIARAWKHEQKCVVERDRNWGLANSIIAGVTQLCERYGTAIVVEDDLVVSSTFLRYLNAALERYANNERVMQISAHMFPVEIESTYDAIMLPFTTSWGWATWERAWKEFDPSQDKLAFERLRDDRNLRRKFDLGGAYPYFRMLRRQASGRIDSWAIRWYLTVFLRNGLTLYPCHSLVRNEGYGPDATHALMKNRREVISTWEAEVVRFPPADVQAESLFAVCRFLRAETSLFRWISGRVRSIRRSG